MKDYKTYWKELIIASKQSLTMLVSVFWIVVTVTLENITFLSGVVGQKWYPYVLIGTTVLARLHGLSKDVKTKAVK